MHVVSNSFDKQQPINLNTNVMAIVALIQRNNKAKFPGVRFLIDEKEFKIYKSGPKSRYPGSLSLVDGEGIWYGTVQMDGTFLPRYLASGEASLIIKSLQQLGNDPEEAAREYGRKTGKCCFCGLTLDDERSLLMGYGPVCARNWALSWGDRPLN